MTNPTEPTQPPELPPEVFAELLVEATEQRLSLEGIARLAYAAGADAELKACCEWLREDKYPGLATRLRATRRPRPPSLKEQALEQLACVDADLRKQGIINTATIRRALESLPDPQ